MFMVLSSCIAAVRVHLVHMMSIAQCRALVVDFWTKPEII